MKILKNEDHAGFSRITNLPTPIEDGEAATMDWVNAQIAASVVTTSSVTEYTDLPSSYSELADDELGDIL